MCSWICWNEEQCVFGFCWDEKQQQREWSVFDVGVNGVRVPNMDGQPAGLVFCDAMNFPCVMFLE